ncbi:MAG: RDD family protein [Chloroflexota bacterium]
MSESYRLDTPEHVSVTYDVAGIGSRFLAALIDAALVGVATAPLAGALWLMTLGSLSAPFLAGRVGTVLLSLVVALATLLLFLLLFGYYIFFEMLWNGQSPGKRWTGLRVLRQTGYPITLVDSVLRNVLRLIDFLPAFYALGAAVMIVDRRARRLGDLVAGTMVIKERRVSLEDVTRRAAFIAPPAPSLFALPNAERLTAEDLRLVRGFLDRRASLPAPRRRDLARQISDVLMVKLETRDVIYDREAFLEQIAAERHA